jgi:hypothetical protein
MRVHLVERTIDTTHVSLWIRWSYLALMGKWTMTPVMDSAGLVPVMLAGLAILAACPG